MNSSREKESCEIGNTGLRERKIHTIYKYFLLSSFGFINTFYRYHI